MSFIEVENDYNYVPKGPTLMFETNQEGEVRIFLKGIEYEYDIFKDNEFQLDYQREFSDKDFILHIDNAIVLEHTLSQDLNSGQVSTESEPPERVLLGGLDPSQATPHPAPLLHLPSGTSDASCQTEIHGQIESTDVTHFKRHSSKDIHHDDDCITH